MFGKEGIFFVRPEYIEVNSSKKAAVRHERVQVLAYGLGLDQDGRRGDRRRDINKFLRTPGVSSEGRIDASYAP